MKQNYFQHPIKMPQDEDLLTESFSARRKCFTIFQRITVVSNIIFALFAVLLIALGAVAVRELNAYSQLAKVSIPAGLIVLGVILLIIIILGLVGSFKKDSKVLLAYFLLLFIFIICQFGVGGGAYSYRATIPQRLDTAWGAISDLNRNNFQQSFNCCGWSNVYDQPGSICPNGTFNSTTNSTSQSMEEFSFEERGVNYTTGSFNATISCEDIIVSYFSSQLYAVGTVGIVFATLQLVALLSSIVVYAFIRVEQSRNQEERF